MGLQIDEAVHLVQPTTGLRCCPKKYITANALYSDRKEEERISGGEKMEERKVYQEQKREPKRNEKWQPCYPNRTRKQFANLVRSGEYIVI